MTRYDFRSYGKLEGDLANPQTDNLATYTGRQDDGNGLMYYRARFYDPELERFISDDPHGDSQRYASENPISTIDPMGLDGVGFIAGSSLEGGSPIAGLGGHVDGGVGVFSNGGSVAKGTGVISLGSFTSEGAFVGGLLGDISNPDIKSPKFAGGGYFGGGGGAFYTNAGYADQLKGPFDIFTLNTPIFSISHGESGNVYINSITFGPGAYGSISRYQTNTTVAPIIILTRGKAVCRREAPLIIRIQKSRYYGNQ